MRHAHRDTEVHSKDNGLSEKGRKQVKRLLESLPDLVLDDDFQGREVRVFSSPKLRCQETIQPLAKAWGWRVEVDPRLIETQNFESDALVRRRIEDVLSEWSKDTQNKLWVLCSHGDILPLIGDALNGVPLILRKAGFAYYERIGKQVVPQWIVQKLI